MHRGRLLRVQAQQPANALGGLAFIAEGMLDDAHPQIRDVDAFRELRHAGQALNVARVKFLQVGLAVLVLGVVGVLSLLFSLLLIAGKEQHFFRKLTGQVGHVASLAGVVH